MASSAPTFPNVRVSLNFLISILESSDNMIITPTHILAVLLHFNFDNVIKIIIGVKAEKSEGMNFSVEKAQTEYINIIKAFRDYDQDEIHRIMREQCESGCENSSDCEGLRGWLLSMALRLVSKVVEGEEVEEELLLMNQVATMLREQGRLEEAEVVFRRGLAGNERVLGVDHPRTLISINNLGVLLKDQGKLEEAEVLYRRDLEGSERVLGADDPDTLISVNNLGWLLKDQGKLDEAEPLLRRALEEQERVLPVNHRDTLASVDSLGRLLQAQGKYDEAEPLLRRCLEEAERVFGVDHPDTLTSVDSLGDLLSAQGKYDEAELLHRRALEGQERVLRVNHPDTLHTRGNLGSLLMKRGDESGKGMVCDVLSSLLSSPNSLTKTHPWIIKFNQALAL